MPLPEFDFIIVGTGAGGGLTAARLVNAGFSVLSLEAGVDFWEDGVNKEKASCTQITANDEMFWDWIYKSEADVTGYEGTWAGLITVLTTGVVGSTYTINGVALTPAGGPRTPGSNDYDDTLGTTELIAADIWAAINDPLNAFKGAGAKGRTSRNFVIIDRVLPVVGATTLASSNPAKGTAVVQSNGPITRAQATIGEFDQTMGRMVGGSGNHFIYLCYRASIEDYDEWDYALTKNTTAAADGIGVLTGTMDFSASPVVTGAPGTLFLTELKVGDYIQDMSSPFPVGGSVPHRIAAIASNTSLTLAADPTGKAFPTGGPGSFGLKNTIWNRSRMLTAYNAIENDLQYGPAGTNPSPTPIHGSNPFPAAEIGYVGKDGLGDTGAWNTAPPATSRVPVALDAIVTNLTGSVAAMPAGRVPEMPVVPTFAMTLDRNGQNNWGTATIPNPGAPITGIDPWAVHKYAINEIGTDSAAVEIAGGRQTGMAFHLNKYAERRSPLVTAIDPIRTNPLFTLRTSCVVDKVLCEDSGSGLTAVGVEFFQRAAEGGAWSTQTAYGKNIVLSAGPLGSPAILLRSGIGPIDRLAPHGISQLLNLPGVGADVINHPTVGAGSTAAFTLPVENNLILSSQYYAGAYKSSYTMSPSRKAAFSVGGFVAPPRPAVLFDQGPDCLYFLIARAGNETAPIPNNLYGLPTKQNTKVYSKAVTASFLMLKTRSRGDGVRLRSAWPFDPPQFRDGRVEDPNAFEVESFVEQSTAVSARFGDPTVVGGLNPTTFPGGSFSLPTVTQPPALSDWGAALGRVATIHGTVGAAVHAVSMVKMGPPSEKLAGFRSCCDSFGRVYGVKNLAVCDLNIYPVTVRATVWLPTVACAENLSAAWIQNAGLDF